MAAGQITHTRIFRVLIAGFSLVILLLMTGGFVGVRNIQSLQESAAALVREQSVTNRLIDEVQRQQLSLGEVFSILARDPDSVDVGRIYRQLDETDRNIVRISAAGLATPQKALWRQLQQASGGFSAEVRRLLAEDEPETFVSRDLFRRHADVVEVTTKLIDASYRKVLSAQEEIDQRSERLLYQSLLFLGGCLLLAVISTWATVRVTTQLARDMEAQAGELSRVSWYLLESQESTARRFSHELHDELGQSLTAVKSNLLGLEREPEDTARLQDCLKIVEEAIGNVRQLSQLLRPTILDDFGLEAGLRWLCEGFEQRTGIVTSFSSRFAGRLPDEYETHLFRIAQEALTNVARHSGATRVDIGLAQEGGQIALTIQDNGRGLPETAEQAKGMGLIGMRARARSAGGDVKVVSDSAGVRIEVMVPEQNEKHGSNTAG